MSSWKCQEKARVLDRLAQVGELASALTLLVFRDAFEIDLDRRNDARCELVMVDVGKSSNEAANRGAHSRCRAVTRRVGSDEPEPERYFLSHFDPETDGVAAAASSAAFIEKKADPFEKLRAILDEPAGSIEASSFFVRGRHEDHVSIEGFPRTMECYEGLKLQHPGALHVERAASPEISVADLARERMRRPVVFVSGHDVGVIEKYQRGLAASFESGQRFPRPGADSADS